jgi:hypothetical protein
MNPSAKLLCVGLILLALGLGGFYFYWGARDRSLVEEAAGTDPWIACSLRVERGHVYEVSLSAENSAGLPWNKVDVEASVLFDGETIYSDSFAVSEFPGKSARDGFSFRADVRSDGLLMVDGYMREGQRWRVSVYRDLPPFLDAGPFVCAIVGLLGLIGVVQSGEVS